MRSRPLEGHLGGFGPVNGLQFASQRLALLPAAKRQTIAAQVRMLLAQSFANHSLQFGVGLDFRGHEIGR